MIRTCRPSKAQVSAAARLEDPEVGLMLRVQRDDAAAFSELLERYWRQVFGRFYRRLGDRQEAEDLAQDVFLRLYRYRKRYQPRAKFATWLFHIAQNVLRNALRTRRRHACMRFGIPPDLPPELRLAEGPGDLPADSPSRPLERAEVAGLVRLAVSSLADRQRTAMELYQFQDRSCAQIAAAMDMTPKAAKSLLYRARHQLRSSLRDVIE